MKEHSAMRRLTCLTGVTLVSTFAAGLAWSQDLTVWEKADRNEQQVAENMAAELVEQITNDYADKGRRVFRDAHPRGIGCVEAKFTVDAALPYAYRTGVFKTPGQSYEALIRFSSSLGPAGDQARDARGMAIKLFGVPGRKLLAGQASDVTHDFLQINAPIFPSRNAEEFAGLVHIKSNPASAVGFLAARPILRARELAAFVGFSQRNPNQGKSLAQQMFFSQVPYLLKGAGIDSPVKFASRPCRAVEARPLDGSDAELRNDLAARLADSDLCYEFLMQFYRDGAGLAIEDGMSEWTEDKAPFVKFATIHIPRQIFATDQKLRYCDNLSFQPWHALPEHRPLGGINRARKIVYEILSDARHGSNGEMAQRIEPTSLAAWRSLASTAYSEWKGVFVEPIR
jgi:hypothetical protein